MTRSAGWTAAKNALKLTAVTAAAWSVFALPVWLLRGEQGLFALTLAATLCLIPGWLVFAFHSQYRTAAPLAVSLTATVGRMIAVLAGALAVKAAWPDLDMTSFALLLGAFYVLSLATETKLLLTPPASGTSAED